jgi:hypothetical protein
MEETQLFLTLLKISHFFFFFSHCLALNNNNK